MDELLAKAMRGVDPDDPSAFVHIFMNLMDIVPWGEMIVWQVVFVVVGGLLGWWRGRLKAGVIASLILGPFGWIVPFLPARQPSAVTPIERRARSGLPPLPSGAVPPAARRPPPLPGSKKP